MSWDSEVLDVLADGYDVHYGARSIKHEARLIYPVWVEDLFVLQTNKDLGRVAKKHLKINGTRNYYFKTIGYCSRTIVKSSLILSRFYETRPWPPLRPGNHNTHQLIR